LSSVAVAAAPLPFTGERVLPGAVEPDLWNEHVSRYRFASLFAEQKHVLDLGCGTGYGAEILADRALHTLGLDSSAEATAFASRRFAKPDFLTASATELPLPSATFGLVTAFEVIEHLSHWPLLLAEAARVLAADGVFLVSTPNKIVYAETRGEAGPNPFHIHEFELEEFQQALTRYFPFVRVLSQNHQAAIVFSGPTGVSAESFLPSAPASPESHFFVAVCAHRPVTIPTFVFVPAAANLLREREFHIQSLQTEVRESRRELGSLLQVHRLLQDELESHNAWALRLDAELARARTQLQNNDAELAAAAAALGTTRTALQAAQLHNDELAAERKQIKNSAWIRLGRALHVGPWSSRVVLPEYVSRVGRQAKELALYLAAPFALASAAVTLLAVDLAFFLFGKRRPPPDSAPRHHAASIIIPNWNGRDLLARFLPPLLAAVPLDSGNEIIVVDNASTDGSSAFLREHFPEVRVLQLSRNLGFAGGANAGVAAAENEVVLLLNNDMRVRAGFLAPLLQHFADPLVFAVSSQIFFSDPQRRREETGLTETWWENGFLGVGHRIDPAIDVAYPCAYPGGGSSAFDRRKFLQLGGFDALFHPFYYEDTDLGRLAWKGGWKVLYEPSSVVFHEHRGTIGKHFSAALIESVLRKNAILYCWKNIHDWRLLGSHFRASLASSVSVLPFRPALTRCSSADVFRAFQQLPRAFRSRWRALSSKAVSDREAFLRPLGGYFRDRFLVPSAPVPSRLNVLFVSPYPIEPPVHGGAVFMKETLTPLSAVADVHLLSFLDTPEQLAAHGSLSSLCKTAQFMVRPHFPIDAFWTLTPSAMREFAVKDFAWLIQRSIYLQNIDVLQLEYTILGQYAGRFRHIPCLLFEHDISVQSLGRRLRTCRFDADLFLEYLRMRFYEPRLLKRFTRVQVCSAENARYLLRLVPSLRGRVDSNVRAAIDTRRYHFVSSPRVPDTLLFLGSFRHSPNLDALRWFTQEVFPKILAARPAVTFHIVGSDPPQSSTIWNDHPNIRLLGAVPDIKEPLQRFAVFICPVLSGSGVRVKLLEAFACGIPAVSTTIGAEGLAKIPGEFCELADSPDAFAASVLHLLANPEHRLALALRSRQMVERERDSRDATSRLESLYRDEAQRLRSLAPAAPKLLTPKRLEVGPNVVSFVKKALHPRKS